jgi:hypothetical protein
MIPYFYAIDEFFSEGEFKFLRAYAYQLSYGDVVAPFDGVTYPNIGLPVPPIAEERLAQALSWLMGYKVVPKFVAFRLSLEGSKPPQWAHSDAQVARFSMFLYMNDGPGGTVLLEHVDTGMRVHPRNEEELSTWKRDYEDESKWRVRAAVDCAANRAVVMRSELLHAALPRGGFGTTVENGRLILICFFD